MFEFRIRGRRWWLAAIAIALVVSVAVPLLRSRLEQAVRARIETAAVRRGVIARIGVVHIGVRPLVRLDGVDLDLRYGLRAHANMIAATWPGHLQFAVRGAALVGPAGISVSAPATVWDATGTFDDDLRLALVAPQAGLSIHKLADPAGGGLNIELHGLDVGRLFDVRRDSHPLLDGGIEDGRVEFQFSSDVLRFHVDMGARGARVVALADHDDGEFQLGDPTDVTMRLDGTWRRAGAVVDIPEVHATWAGADLSGSIALRDLDTDPAGDLALGVQHLDFVQLLDASGLGVPESLGLAPGAGRDLGSVSIDLHIRGRLSDPTSLSVTPKVDFKPPREIPPAILRLRGDFVFSSQQGSGPQRPIDVSPASPDFIALHDVPPLFVRTLLLSEDAGFYGHHGIDLRELPIALLTDWARGGAARGASTITQQLAKNLFLSRDKQLGRKLQELAITFLLESALGKNRILEIYLNIIEWGPDLRGLRPAARSYFGREPRELTPAEMAFLVAIIPGPIKYQASFAHGMPGPGLRSLIDDLLAKLRSVDAIGEEEYRQALDEPIVVAGGRPR